MLQKTFKNLLTNCLIRFNILFIINNFKVEDAKSSYVEYILQRTGVGESQEMESIMKRVAEMDRTKPIGEYLIPHPKRYLA